jgi:hypothetical protein
MFGQDFIERHSSRQQPLCVAFNAAVMTLANATCPFGWHIEDSYVRAPHSLADLNAAINTHGKMVVWGGASEDQIFACDEHLSAFRAWHDSVHHRHQMPFNLAGEAAVAYVQAYQLLVMYGHDEETERYVAIILTEIIGQALFKAQYAEFPQSPREFTTNTMHRWENLAGRLCVELTGDKVTERTALKLAKETWGKA